MIISYNKKSRKVDHVALING